MASPFGISVGDFVAVGKAAYALYQRIQNCESELGVLKEELRQLIDLLTNLRDLSTRVKLSGAQFAQLVEREKESQALIEDLSRTLDRYEPPKGKKLPLSKKVKWSRGVADGLRSRLTSHVSMLTGSYMSISQAAVLDALEIVKLNVQTGKTKCPSIATMSQSSFCDETAAEDEWRDIVLDLENLGITPAMVKAHRKLTLRYFENAVAHGELPFANEYQSLYSGSISGYQVIAQHISSWMEGWTESGSMHESEHHIMSPYHRGPLSHANSIIVNIGTAHEQNKNGYRDHVNAELPMSNWRGSQLGHTGQNSLARTQATRSWQLPQRSPISYPADVPERSIALNLPSHQLSNVWQFGLPDWSAESLRDFANDVTAESFFRREEPASTDGVERHEMSHKDRRNNEEQPLPLV